MTATRSKSEKKENFASEQTETGPAGIRRILDEEKHSPPGTMDTITGDIVWQDADGYLWYVGRADDVIKSSGYRIGPGEVESVLMKHPAVFECAVTGVPDPVRGQIVQATIVLTKNNTPSDELKVEIQQFVKTNTAPYKYPRAIEFVTSLPKTIREKS